MNKIMQAEPVPTTPRRLTCQRPEVVLGLLLVTGGFGAQAANFDCSWASAASGLWNAAGNWGSCNAAFPNNAGGDTFNAVINQTGADYVTTLNTSATIGTLTLDSANATLSHTAGTLTAAAINLNNGTYHLAGGTIANAIVDGTGGLFQVTANASTLNGATLNRTVNVGSAGTNISLNVLNGLTLDHAAGESLSVFNAVNQTTNGLSFSNTGTLGSDVANGKTGTVLLTPANNATLGIRINTSGTLTIGAGVTVKTANAGTDSRTRITSATDGTLLNLGTISSETAGQLLEISPTNTVNTGTLAAKNGGILTLDRNWTSEGGILSLDADPNSTLNLDGSFATASLGGLSRGVNGLNGVVNVTGALDNNDATLLLDNTTGTLNFGNAGNTARITGGSIDVAPGSASRLKIVNRGNFDAVTLLANQSVGSATEAASLGIDNGLTLDHEVGEALTLNHLTGATTRDLLIFGTSGTIGAAAGKTGEIKLISGSGRTLDIAPGANQSITIGPGVTVKQVDSLGNARYVGGSNNTLLNQGTLAAESSGRTFTVQPTSLTNSGTLAARNGGILTVGSNATNLTNLASNTLTGGTYQAFANSTLNFGTATFSTNAANILLDGVGSVFNAVNPLATNADSFALQNGRNFTTAGALTNGGTLGIGANSILNIAGALTSDGSIVMNGGTLDATGTVTNNAAADIIGFGTLNDAVINHGVVRASGGNLTAIGGIDGQSGTIQIDSGATLILGANSDGDFLINNGTLVLNSFNVTVAQDYTNANFGTGNDFNARTNVTGTGLLLAAGDVAQAITGAVSGSGPNYTMTFGNVHVGDSNARVYQIANTGTEGASLRGAIQTSINGGNITDGRLSGSGATAGNFGPLATGTDSGDLTVTFNATSAGALIGQVLNIANNFDNVGDSEISIVDSAAYRFADASSLTPNPVALGNRRVGDVAEQFLTLENLAADDGFSEGLNAVFGTLSGNATASGSVTLLAAGESSSNTLKIGIDTSSAGDKAGTALVNFSSDGAGTSGLGQTVLDGTGNTVNEQQSVTVSGKVFRLASAGAHTPEPAAFGNVHVGDVVALAVSLTNNAVDDGFSERLNASIGDATGDATTNNGSFSLLAAGASNDVDLTVGLNTATAGAKSGTATITLASDGAGTSGFEAFGLGTQTVNVTGAVYRLAQVNLVGDLIFGNVHVGDELSQALLVQNLAAADGFSESLNASFGAASDARILTAGSITRLAAGGSDNASMVVTIDTATAGLIDGTLELEFESDGLDTSGLGVTALDGQIIEVDALNTAVAVFRFASPVILNEQPIDFGSYRVGDVASDIGLSILNDAPADGFSESLNASTGATGTGFNATGAITQLAAGGTDIGGIAVGIDTTTAGLKEGSAQIDFVSSGEGTSGLGETALAGQDVELSGKVYAPAIADVQTLAIDYGIVHKGDVVAARAITVQNDATGALTDVLTGSVSATGSFAGTGGTLAVLAAGATDSSTLLVTLDTAIAGVFNGDATITFASHNPDMLDLSLDNALVALSAQVNEFANPVLTQTGGDGTFSADGATFTLDFGTVEEESLALTGLLQIANVVGAPADSLRVEFAGSAPDFGLTGFSTFSLAAGEAQALIVTLDPLIAGIFDQVITLNLFGFNASGFDQQLGSFSLNLQGTVLPPSAIPLPAGVWLMGSALVGLLGARRNMRRTRKLAVTPVLP